MMVKVRENILRFVQYNLRKTVIVIEQLITYCG